MNEKVGLDENFRNETEKRQHPLLGNIAQLLADLDYKLALRNVIRIEKFGMRLEPDIRPRIVPSHGRQRNAELLYVSQDTEIETKKMRK